VRGVTGYIDLTVYPPPDLAIEVVVTHSPAKSLAVCRELGVPEV
jgi:Uma2 family endonuclease